MSLHHHLQPHLGHCSYPFFFAMSGPFSSLLFSDSSSLNYVIVVRGDEVVVVRRPQVYGGLVCFLMFLGWLATGFGSCCVLTHLDGIIFFPTLVPKGKVPYSAPSMRGNSIEADENLVGRYLISTETTEVRIHLRFVPSPLLVCCSSVATTVLLLQQLLILLFFCCNVRLPI